MGLIATYARWKGQDVFLRRPRRWLRPIRRGRCASTSWAARSIRRAGRSFRRPSCAAWPSAWGVEGRVGFLGFQDDPVAAFRSLDVVVHASTRPEPFGLTIVEAMACGKPVLVAQAGGAAELFRDGHDALGVPPGDAQALAAALRHLLDDGALRARLGEHARQTVLARFRPEGLGSRFLHIYREMRHGAFPSDPTNSCGRA